MKMITPSEFITNELARDGFERVSCLSVKIETGGRLSCAGLTARQVRGRAVTGGSRRYSDRADRPGRSSCGTRRRRLFVVGMSTGR